MKQVAQNYRSGDLSVIDVPEPSCRRGGVLVRTLFSLISTGTEMTKVNEARLSLIGKARARPDQVRKVLDSVSQQGFRTTYTKAMDRLDTLTPLGYSTSGVVIEVGHGAEEFRVGQLVSCAGNEHALHAEVNWVPTNLCVPVPDNVSPESAAFGTVGAIALHGVRRSGAQVGETSCVIGLGLIGQIVVRLLTFAGVRVVGLDVSPERCKLAEEGGAICCDEPTSQGLDHIERVLGQLTQGYGADHVLLTAGGASNGPVEAAIRLARDRARLVDVGKVSLNLPWNACYDKELDIRFSRSYGPGRYDESYELQGNDYPIGYVRWTERRNLQSFLELASRGLDVAPLLSGMFSIQEAESVYARLRDGGLHGVGFLFSYPSIEIPAARTSVEASPPDRGTVRPRRSSNQLQVGFIGAGSYASSMLLPNIKGRPEVELAVVATNTPLSAVTAQRRFGFSRVTTDAADVIEDASIDAVFIVTRHESHADLVCRALEAGKAVFVEKPLALTEEQFERVAATVRKTGNSRLAVGFNRRFSPLLTVLRSEFGRCDGGTVLRYLVNAGQLDTGSWYLDAPSQGSRFLGEGGHFIDTASWFLESDPVEVYASETDDQIHAVLHFENSSMACIDYVTKGHPRFPKETIEVSSGGRTARFENFKRATVWVGRRPKSLRSRGRPDKGQANEVDAFIRSVQLGEPMPIDWRSIAATTQASLAVERSIVLGSSQKV